MTDSKTKKARQLVKITYEDMFSKTCEDVRRQLMTERLVSYRGLPETVLTRIFEDIISCLVITTVMLFNEYFSEEELDELLRIHEVPIFRKFQKLQPEITEKMQALCQKLFFNNERNLGVKRAETNH